MPQSEVLASVARDLKGITVAVAEAKDLIDALKEAGENVAELEASLRTLEVRKTRWERMLKARGFSFED